MFYFIDFIKRQNTTLWYATRRVAAAANQISRRAKVGLVRVRGPVWYSARKCVRAGGGWRGGGQYNNSGRAFCEWCMALYIVKKVNI